MDIPHQTLGRPKVAKIENNTPQGTINHIMNNNIVEIISLLELPVDMLMTIIDFTPYTGSWIVCETLRDLVKRHSDWNYWME